MEAVGLGKAQEAGLWELLPVESSCGAASDLFPGAAGVKGSFSLLLTEVFKQQWMHRLFSV